MIQNRFYSKKFPIVDDVVIVQVLDRTEYGYNTKMLEYANKLAFVTHAEIARKTRHRKKHIVKEGDIFPMSVIMVDQSKDVVNLSKRYITDEDITNENIRYKHNCNLHRLAIEVHNMYKNLTDTYTDADIEKSMNATVWPLYDTGDGLSAKKILEKILEDPTYLFKYNKDHFPKQFVDKMIDNLRSRIQIDNSVVDTLIKVLILSEGGVTTLQQILDQDLSLPDNPGYKATIEMVSSPVYKISVQGHSQKTCTDIVNTLSNKIKQLTTDQGMFAVCQEPTVDISGSSTKHLKYLQLHELTNLIL